MREGREEEGQELEPCVTALGSVLHQREENTTRCHSVHLSAVHIKALKNINTKIKRPYKSVGRYSLSFEAGL